LYIERGEIKQAAKDDLRRAQPNPMLATLVFFIITFGINLVVDYFTGLPGGRYYEMLRSGYHVGMALGTVYGGVTGAFVIFFKILLALFTMILNYGYYAVYSLSLSRLRDADIRSFFAGFERPVRIIAVQILMSVFILLWSLLFLIPGIVAAYRYRLALYLMADDPELGAMDAIRQSKVLMNGYKGQAFVLDLSFIGWWLLTPLTLGILGLWVTPYFSVTCANFYQAVLRGADGQEEPPPPSGFDCR
jgi:uncharacterized membrane protein